MSPGYNYGVQVAFADKAMRGLPDVVVIDYETLELAYCAAKSRELLFYLKHNALLRDTLYASTGWLDTREQTMNPRTVTNPDPTDPQTLEVITTVHTTSWCNCSPEYKAAVLAARKMGAELRKYDQKSLGRLYDNDSDVVTPDYDWNNPVYMVKPNWLPPLKNFSPAMLEALRKSDRKFRDLPKWHQRALKILVGTVQNRREGRYPKYSVDSGPVLLWSYSRGVAGETDPSGHVYRIDPEWRPVDWIHVEKQQWICKRAHQGRCEFPDCCSRSNPHDRKSATVGDSEDIPYTGSPKPETKKDTATMKQTEFYLTALANSSETPFHKLNSGVQEQFRAAIKLGAKCQILNVKNVWVDWEAGLMGASAIVRIINWNPPKPEVKITIGNKEHKVVAEGEAQVFVQELHGKTVLMVRTRRSMDKDSELNHSGAWAAINIVVRDGKVAFERETGISMGDEVLQPDRHGRVTVE